MRKIWVVIGLLVFLVACASKPKIGPLGSIHTHQDFKVYIEGQEFDFSQRQYQVREQYVHVEDGIGETIHVHATGVTTGVFFDSLGMKFTKECFTMGSGKEYCNEGDKTLKLYVNGKPNEELGDYLMGDKDRFLVSYGNETEEEIQEQLASIPDFAKELE